VAEEQEAGTSADGAPDRETTPMPVAREGGAWTQLRNKRSIAVAVAAAIATFAGGGAVGYAVGHSGADHRMPGPPGLRQHGWPPGGGMPGFGGRNFDRFGAPNGSRGGGSGQGSDQGLEQGPGQDSGGDQPQGSGGAEQGSSS